VALATVHFRSNSIHKETALNVLLPEIGEGPFPTLYLLHGLSDDHSAWMRYSAIERYVCDLPLIIVMPDGYRSYYVNDPRPEGLAFEDHIVRDVVGFVDRTFPTRPSRAGRAIAGLSMGGYGAITLAMRHPEMFCAAASHSGALSFVTCDYDRPGLRELPRALKREQHDPSTLAESLVNHDDCPAIRFDCGVDDHLIDHNRDLHAKLEAMGIEHEYREHPGGHTWAYWDEHIRETIAFVTRQFAGNGDVRRG
jgi:S-formylglutathione hydrolase FrmB